MYGFEGVGLSEVQLSISELSVVGGWWLGGAQTHFMVGPGRGPTKSVIWMQKAGQFGTVFVTGTFVCDMC